MRTEEIKIYRFEELKKESQKRAIERYKDADIFLDFFVGDWEHQISEIGFIDPKIRYSLGYCQGDGASFTFDTTQINNFNFSNSYFSKIRKVINKFYIDINNLDFLDREQKKEIYADLLATEIPCNVGFHRYSHHKTVSCNAVEFHDYNFYTDEEELTQFYFQHKILMDFIDNFQNDIEREFTFLIQKIGKEIEISGYAEIEYQNSDGYIQEMIIRNDYEFLESGEIY